MLYGCIMNIDILCLEDKSNFQDIQLKFKIRCGVLGLGTCLQHQNRGILWPVWLFWICKTLLLVYDAYKEER